MLKLTDPDLLRNRCLIDNQWSLADSGASFDVVDPASGVRLGAVPAMGANETRRAIDAANRA